MAEPSPTKPASDWIGSSIIWGLFLLIFVAAPVYNAFFRPPDDNLPLVLADAEVTDVSETNRRFSYHLNGDDQEEYNFRDFVAADPAARKGFNGDVGWDSSDLSHYLRLGDRLTKAAHSPWLTVQRGPIITRWVLSTFTPEAEPPPPVNIAILPEGDTVVIP